MARRDRRRAISLREAPPPPRPLPTASRPPAVLEDRIAIQHREIQALLVENQRMAATHVALKQDVALARQDIQRLSAAAVAVKAERDEQVREVYERSLKMDAEARAVDAMGAELAQVRADVQKLAMQREELVQELQDISSELAKVRGEAKIVPIIRGEIEKVQREIQRGRAAIEHEKKTHASNLEHGQVMEKNMVALTHEIERLQAELANAETRARAAAAAANPNPGYAGGYGNPEVTYGAALYSDPYTVHQVQGGVATAAPFVSGGMPNGPSDMPQTHVHR